MPKVVDTSEVQELLRRGAQLIEVLPSSAWQREHVPGARNVPLPQLRADTVADLDHGAPTVVYCYDHECDLSARGAAVLEQLGFTEVYDYAGSKTAWLGEGLPADGDVAASDRAGARATWPPTCPPHATIDDIVSDLRGDLPVVVLGDGDVVLGAVHPAGVGLPPSTPVLRAADPGTATVRPSITRSELARSMDDGGQRHVIVTTSHGRLIGVVRRSDLD